jgi:hypothetical protein
VPPNPRSSNDPDPHPGRRSGPMWGKSDQASQASQALRRSFPTVDPQLASLGSRRLGMTRSWGMRPDNASQLLSLDAGVDIRSSFLTSLPPVAKAPLASSARPCKDALSLLRGPSVSSLRSSSFGAQTLKLGTVTLLTLASSHPIHGDSPGPGMQRPGICAADISWREFMTMYTLVEDQI